MQTHIISHISYSSAGGAGNIATKLVDEQKKMGFDSRLHTVSNLSVSEEPLKHPLVTATSLVDQYLLGASGAELLTPLRSKFGLVPRRDFEDSDVIHLHWLPGAISDFVLAELLGTGRKVIWTLHDFRPITGACHYTKGCTQFQEGCKRCPQVKGLFRGVISKSFREKLNMFSGSRLALVTPSLGLAAAAEKSMAAENLRVEYIPNPISSSLLERGSRIKRAETSPRNFIFLAANVAEERKGLQRVLDWWEEFRSSGQKLILVGQNSDKYTSSSRGLKGMGSLTKQKIQDIFEDVDVLVFASSEDNAPGVIAEGVAAGIPILVLGADMRTWLTQEGTPLISEEQLRSATDFNEYFDDNYAVIRELFLQKRTPRVVAERYLELYQSITT